MGSAERAPKNSSWNELQGIHEGAENRRQKNFVEQLGRFSDPTRRTTTHYEKGGKLNLFPTTKGRKDKHKKAVLNQESGKQAARLGTPSNGSLQGQQREQITDDNAAEYGLTESGGDDEEPNGAKKTVSATGPGFSSSTKFPPTLWAATDVSSGEVAPQHQKHLVSGDASNGEGPEAGP